MHRTLLLLTSLLLVACQVRSASLSAPDAARLAEATAAGDRLGELVYRGDVRTQQGGSAFTYERRVRQEGDNLVSTHLSHDGEGSPVVLHAATHDAAYRLAKFEEVHAQTGVAGTLVVAAGRATFTVRGPGGVFTRTQTVRDPVVVGPTLFGFARTHWDALRGGDIIPLRFAVVDRARTYAFRLRQVPASRGEVAFELAARSAVLRLAVPPMRIVFDAEGRNILRYEGRVPPRLRQGKRLREFDAVVRYTAATDRFR